MALVRKQTYITPVQDRAIKRLAQQQGTSESEVLRIALNEFLIGKGVVETEDPFAELIGMFSGPGDVDHCEII